MEIRHLATYKSYDGLIYIEVSIDGNPKIYTYVLGSEFFQRKFEQLYRSKKTHGRALQVLKKANLNKERGYA